MAQGKAPARASRNPPQSTAIPAPVSYAPPKALSYTILALTTIAIFSRYWAGIGDFDFWWHLKTGQYISQNHRLPVPDPFAYTTYLHPDAYPGESQVRYFNLTHEWLAQLAYFGVYSLAGATGVAALRALLITLTCGLAGLVVWRRSGGFYRPLATSLLVSASAVFVAGERPHLFSYFLLTVVLAILEFRRWHWALPPIFLIWANCHGAYFLGWAALGAYCADALLRRWRGGHTEDDRKLYICAALAVLASGINPNGFHIFETLLAYRRSPMQATIVEWQRPKYWEFSTFTFLLYAAFAALLWARRRARISDWILYLLFAAASLTAMRNIILIGIMGSIILTSYIPVIDPSRYLRWKGVWPIAAAGAAILFLGHRIVTMPHRDANETDWRVPSGAADFLLAHHVTAPLFNAYDIGGYLIWRLWPHYKVFEDGRALSETAYANQQRIAYNADSSTGPSAEDLLNRYHIGVIVMPMIDFTGTVYLLPAALSDPSQHQWKLVFADRNAVIYMKDPPPDVTPLPSTAALATMEAQCTQMLDTVGNDCARGVANLYSKIGDPERAAQWMAVYNSRGGGANSRFEVVR